MKTPDSPEGKPSAPDRCNHNPRQDLFPETLKPVEHFIGSIGVTGSDESPRVAPIVSGQCAQVLELIRKHGPVLSFVLTADHAIPETAARVHDLRAMGFNIVTTMKPEVVFRSSIRRNAALYSIGTPEWPAPGLNAGA